MCSVYGITDTFFFCTTTAPQRVVRQYNAKRAKEAATTYNRVGCQGGRVQGQASLSIWVGMEGTVTEMSPASAWATTAASSCASMWDSMLVLSRLLAWGQQLELQLPPDSVEPESNGTAMGEASEAWET